MRSEDTCGAAASWLSPGNVGYPSDSFFCLLLRSKRLLSDPGVCVVRSLLEAFCALNTTRGTTMPFRSSHCQEFVNGRKLRCRETIYPTCSFSGSSLIFRDEVG